MTPLLKATNKVGTAARDAALAAYEKGGSPRAQIDAGRAASGRALGYLPHQSKRETERRAKRMAALAK